MSIQYNVYSVDRSLLKAAISSIQARREVLIKSRQFGTPLEKKLSTAAKKICDAIDIINELELKSYPTDNSKGWDAVLVVGGYTVPTTQITDSIRIIRTENDAALMDVIIRPTIGLQDLDMYQGKTVTLDIQNSSGIFRAYTGVVDIPEIDLLNETITLRCTDKRSVQSALCSFYWHC